MDNTSICRRLAALNGFLEPQVCLEQVVEGAVRYLADTLNLLCDETCREEVFDELALLVVENELGATDSSILFLLRLLLR
jgi:hypothetical protein